MNEGCGIAYVVEILQKADIPEAVRKDAINAIKAERLLDERIRNLQYEAPEVGAAIGRQLGLELMANYLGPVFEKHNLPVEQGRNVHRLLDDALSKGIYQIVQESTKAFGESIGAEPKR